MASKVVLFSEAKKDLSLLPQKARERVVCAIDALVEFPVVKTGIKMLKPPFSGFRKRAGSIRILFEYDHGTVFIHGIKDRKDAYR